MSLQVRLTHSLGERLIELEAQGADRPAIVGRAAEAHVPVPSASIGKQHCLFFVHEGRWVVQDGGSQAGTYLNGERISDPSFLNTGDVVALGPGSTAPTVLIDPHGLGVSEEFVQSAPLPVSAPAAAHRAVASPAAALPQPGGYAPSYAAPPQPQYYTPAPAGFVDSENAAEADDDNIFGAPAHAVAPAVAYQPPSAPPRPAYGAPAHVPGYGAPGAYAPPQPASSNWTPPAVETHAPRKSIRKKNQGTNPAVIIAVGVVGLIAVIVLVVIVVQRQKENAAPIVIVKPAPPPVVAKSTSIFDNSTGSGRPVGESSATVKPKITKPATAPGARITPPGGGSSEPEMVTPEIDTKKSDPKYQPIDEARLLIDSGKPSIAVARLLDLEESGNPFKKEISDFKDQAYDRIWWLRISDLLEERIKYQKEIADRKQQIKEAIDAEFKAGLQKEIAKIETRLSSVDNNLKTMQYPGSTSPKDLKDSELAVLKSQRDEEKFKVWRKEVESSIRRSHGERLPWRQTN